MARQDPFRQTFATILAELGRMLENVPERTTNRFADLILRAPRIFVTGQGRSGLMVKAFAQRLMQMGFDTHASEEITTPAIARGDLLVVCSGTGETPVNILRARIAKRMGAQVVLITARPRSTLARMARLRIILGARVGREASWHATRSIQPIRSLFEQALLLYLDAAVLWLMRRRGVREGRMARRHANLD